MRYLAISLVVALSAIYATAQNPAATAVSAQQRSTQSEHVGLSTPLVKAWREIPVNSPAYALGDASISKDWMEHSLIQHIESQTGIWHIWIEPGYSVFRIYPYLNEKDPPPSFYQGIVLKVKGNLSTRDLLAAIQSRDPNVSIDEYEIFGPSDLAVQRHSRAHHEN